MVQKRYILIAFLCVVLRIAAYEKEQPSTINWFVGNTEPGEWIEYKNVWLSTGNYQFYAQVLAEKSNQTIQLTVNGSVLQPNVVVPVTDTFTLMQLGSKNISEGYFDLRLVFNTGNVNCDMFYVNKASNPLTHFTWSSQDDGMSIAPIGDQSYASGTLVNVGDRLWGHKDKQGNAFSQDQMLSYFKLQSYVYTPRNSDQAMDMWVAELIAAKPDFIFMHGRSTQDFKNEIEDRDYKPGNGSLSARLTKKFVEAVNRSPYGKDNIRLAYFQDNATYAVEYKNKTGKEMASWNDPDWMQFTWERWFKPWFDNVPKSMTYQPEPGKVPIQLWTSNISNYNGPTNTMLEFFNYIKGKMKSTYSLEPLWILGNGWFNKDPRLENITYGVQSWFIWSGSCTTMNEFQGIRYSFAVNGKRMPIRNVWYNDWNPATNTGTPAGSQDFHVSALLSDKSELIREHYQKSRELNARWMVLESWSDWQEGTVWYRSDDDEWAYPNQHLALVREYADRKTKSLVFEAEACDAFNDLSKGNAGGEYRYHWHTTGEPDLDIYRPIHRMTPKKAGGNPGILSKLSVGFHEVWGIKASNEVISCEVDANPVKWQGISKQKSMQDIALGYYYVWAIGTDGKVYRSTLPTGWDHYNCKEWVDVSHSKNMKDIDISMKRAWGIDQQGAIYSQDLDGNNGWSPKAGPGAALASITADNEMIAGLTSTGKIYSCRTEGAHQWGAIANPHNVTTIDAGGSELWGLNKNGELYRTSIANIHSWEKVDENIKAFSVGWEYAWTVDNSGNAYQYELYGFKNSVTIPTGNKSIPTINLFDHFTLKHLKNIIQINFTLSQKSHVTITVYNAKGAVLKELMNSKLNPGNYNTPFKISVLSSGIYYCRVQINKRHRTYAFANVK